MQDLKHILRGIESRNKGSSDAGRWVAENFIIIDMIRGLYLNQKMLDVETDRKVLGENILDIFLVFLDVLSIQLGNWRDHYEELQMISCMAKKATKENLTFTEI